MKRRWCRNKDERGADEAEANETRTTGGNFESNGFAEINSPGDFELGLVLA